MKTNLCEKVEKFKNWIVYLEVAGGDADIVVLARVVELGEAPIDQTELSLLMINHYIVRLYIAMHDTHWVAEKFIKNWIKVPLNFSIILKGSKNPILATLLLWEIVFKMTE